MIFHDEWPAKSPAPTAIGVPRLRDSAVADHTANRRWLSFRRWAVLHHTNMKHLTHIIAVSIALVVAGCATQKSSQTSAESGVYTVQSDDTFYKIAKQHHLTFKKLQELNPEMGVRLKIGQKIYVLPQSGK